MSNKWPAKPYPDFPLFAHNNGQWCKKIRGKQYYFGTWSEPDAALQLYLKQRYHLYAGETPQYEGITVADICEQFYAWNSSLTEIGELKPVTLKDYDLACTQLMMALAGTSLGRHCCR